MPVAKNPDAREFFVYAFVANEYPFYIGMGRSARASDRIRYVKYLMRREKLGKPVKWSASSRVIAVLLERGVCPDLQILASGLTRRDALEHERFKIDAYRRKGRLLANRVYNGGNAVSVDDVLRAIGVGNRRSTRRSSPDTSRRRCRTVRR